MRAQDSVVNLKGVGPSIAEKLAKLGIRSIQELVNYVPFRYEDYSRLMRASQIRPGVVTLKVTFSNITSRYSKRGLHMTEATAYDESGSVKVVWFNQPYRASALKTGETYYLSGEFGQNYKYFAITNPSTELVSDFPVNTARIVPVYRLTKGLGLPAFRKAMKAALQQYVPQETLPNWLLKKANLIPRDTALMQMHFPEHEQALDRAKERLGFEEIFELSLASELNKRQFKSEHALEIPFDEQYIKKFVQSLPFQLTDDQRKVAWQIFQDMREGTPMNRLVEGDVGSGKTIVALLAAMSVLHEKLQVAFMAPTELLARQHAETIQNLLAGGDLARQLVLLTGSMSSSQKQNAYQAIASGEASLIIGTHAIFQEKVSFKKLGLVIVDEQHRFGVAQRKAIQAKAKHMPHVLNMTATPIPRSLALTLYGEMDISIIQQLPSGRKPIASTIEIPENRQKVYVTVARELDAGRQAFVVCPQIEESENSRLSVVNVHKELSKKWLRGYRLGLLHGKLAAVEKEAIMKQFVDGALDVLVSTTVIEVGVDIPNATMMVIEAADSFGLAQLHQLRGRVGRGSEKSYCYFITSENTQPKQRLQLLESEQNGFKLADYDLQLRGPGAIYGTMQHGALDLRVAKLTDVELITAARDAARQFIVRDEDLLQYPALAERVSELRAITNFN